MEDRVWLRHFNRGESFCPRCYAALVWRRTGDRQYTPCDVLPVICRWVKTSPMRVVYRGEIVSGVRILTPDNAAEFVGQRTFRALQPHVFTCKGISHQFRQQKERATCSAN